jgi:hypothetical protein
MYVRHTKTEKKNHIMLVDGSIPPLLSAFYKIRKSEILEGFFV